MTPRTELDNLFAQWALPVTAASLALHGPRMREIEQELRGRLAHNDAEATQWIGTQRPAVGSCAYQVQQRTLSRVRVQVGSVTKDACLAFCPVTIVLTTTHSELPRIDVELFRNVRPQPFIEALQTQGLLTDCNVSVDPRMLPAARVAAIGLAELPAIVNAMAAAATLICPVNGTHPSGLPDANQGMSQSVSIAGGRVIGSLLIPLLFFADDLGDLPAVLNGQLPEQNITAFCESASQTLTTLLGRGGPVRIDFIVSAPELIFDALLESATAHCDTAAYWASCAAIALGGTECAVVYDDTPARERGQGVSVAFDAGQGVECSVRMMAIEQEPLDRYTEAFAAGAHAAGMTTVRMAMRTARTPNRKCA